MGKPFRLVHLFIVYMQLYRPVGVSGVHVHLSRDTGSCHLQKLELRPLPVMSLNQLPLLELTVTAVQGCFRPAAQSSHSFQQVLAPPPLHPVSQKS